jgi:hypothetical protein
MNNELRKMLEETAVAYCKARLQKYNLNLLTTSENVLVNKEAECFIQIFYAVNAFR